ncbi:MAG: pirin family protein [Pseudomonadota bacterium]
MQSPRQIRFVFHSQPFVEGAGVHLRRAMGYDQVPLFDPFLMLDDFRSDTPSRYIKGFPWHPHRGIETITYMVDGSAEHGDSMGNSGTIFAGDVQWMTAGSGVIHQEMPKPDAMGRMGGFQLWANLPASRKMMPPRYRDIRASQIPVVALDKGIEIRIICGRVGDTVGPVRDIVIDPEYLDVSLAPGARLLHPTRPGYTVFAYVIQGSGTFGQPMASPVKGAPAPGHDPISSKDHGKHTLLLFSDGDHLCVETGNDPVRFLLISGKPIQEPVVWQGPIVMNTREELDTAFREYRDGTFIRHPKAAV